MLTRLAAVFVGWLPVNLSSWLGTSPDASIHQSDNQHLNPDILSSLRPANFFSIDSLTGNQFKHLIRFVVTDMKGETVLWQWSDAVGKLGVESFGWSAHDGHSFGRLEVTGSVFNFTGSFATDKATGVVHVAIKIKASSRLNVVVFMDPSKLFEASETPSSESSLIIDDWHLERFIQTHKKPRKKGLSFAASQACEASGCSRALIYRVRANETKSLSFGTPGLISKTLESMEETWKLSLATKFSGLESYEAVAGVLGNLAFLEGEVADESPQKKKNSMLTIVPSRSFFPRAFLWDDGFHSLILARTNPEIFARLLISWISIQRPSGWIPRELALSEEDRSRVPEKFLVQRDHIANPPTLLFGLRLLERSTAAKLLEMDAEGKTVRQRLELWYEWLDFSQKSSQNCHRWKGRVGIHTLGSGLDDYPRGIFINHDECHLDLEIWLIFFASSMGNLCPNHDDQCKARWGKRLSELRGILDEKFLVHSTGIHADFLSLQPPLNLVPPISTDGKCSKTVECPENSCCSPSGWCGTSPAHCDCPGCRKSEPLQTRKVLIDSARAQHSQHTGYVTLFPLLFGLVEGLETLEKYVEIVEELLTPFGVASLSPQDKLFQTGENYWRGKIWGNFQVLTVGALEGYARRLARGRDFLEGGPSERASDRLSKRLVNLASQIRTRFTKNTRTNFKVSGFWFEHFHPITGNGGGAAPFTGWTAVAQALLESSDSSWWERAVVVESVSLPVEQDL